MVGHDGTDRRSGDNGRRVGILGPGRARVGQDSGRRAGRRTTSGGRIRQFAGLFQRAPIKSRIQPKSGSHQGIEDRSDGLKDASSLGSGEDLTEERLEESELADLGVQDQQAAVRNDRHGDRATQELAARSATAASLASSSAVRGP